MDERARFDVWASQWGGEMGLHHLDVDGLWLAWQEAVKQEREAAAAICEAKLDVAEEKKAWQKAQDARGGDIHTELNRLKHHNTVNLWNTALRQCAAAIRARSSMESK